MVSIMVVLGDDDGNGLIDVPFILLKKCVVTFFLSYIADTNSLKLALINPGVFVSVMLG